MFQDLRIKLKDYFFIMYSDINTRLLFLFMKRIFRQFLKEIDLEKNR